MSREHYTPIISFTTAIVFGLWQTSLLAGAFMFSFMMGIEIIINVEAK